MTKSEQIRAGIIALAQSLLPFLVLVGALDWTSNQIAGAMLVVTNTVTLAFLLIPNAPPPVP